jgi:hypothetical protein
VDFLTELALQKTVTLTMPTAAAKWAEDSVGALIGPVAGFSTFKTFFSARPGAPWWIALLWMPGAGTLLASLSPTRRKSCSAVTTPAPLLAIHFRSDLIGIRRSRFVVRLSVGLEMDDAAGPILAEPAGIFKIRVVGPVHWSRCWVFGLLGWPLSRPRFPRGHRAGCFLKLQSLVGCSILVDLESLFNFGCRMENLANQGLEQHLIAGGS